jgi:hypothetical protein
MNQRAAGCRDVVPMFRLARGLGLFSYRREWLARDVVAAFRQETGTEWWKAP